MSNGIAVTVDKAIAELRKYRNGLKVMSGGFTSRGGEPLMQDRFAVKLFTAASAMGIHTALDTNGSLGHRLTDSELDKIVLVLLDIKSWDADRHRKLTGMEVGPVSDFARRLSVLKKPVWVRFVLVPGFTVVAGAGNGNMTQAALEVLAAQSKKGIVCVRSSRVVTGRVGRNVEVDDDKLGLIASEGLSPQKARVLLRLALLQQRTLADMQRIFEEY